ncbi:MAG: tripartite tricarboxylate transporter permease [Planctomycetes bacterium]|nr:tripartite tricarboxylate transporter permease [Planctomycetota bacterium]
MEDSFTHIVAALGFFTSVENICLLLVGGFVGVLFASIPGLTGTLGLTIFLPFTYSLPKEGAFIMIVGMIGGTLYGGCLTAIAINIPGAPSSVCTTFDGHPLFKSGQGDRAIGWATLASFIGGTISALLLFFAAPQIARFAIRFGPPEFAAVCIFGMVAVVTLTGDLLKALVSGFFGLLLSTVGGDLHGLIRFTHGSNLLLAGVPLVPVVVGVFALSMVLEETNLFRRREEHSEVFLDAARRYQRMKFPTWAEFKPRIPLLLRCSLIGTFIGFLPGAGGNIAAFVGYNVEKKLSRTPEKYGTGFVDGIAAPESANNAVVGGILIPTLVLGIPGDQFTAIMLGAFLIHGLPVGPLLFRENPTFIYVVFWTALFTNVVMVLYGYFGCKFFVRMAALRKSRLIPIIAIISITGCYAANNAVNSIGMGVIFAAVGFLFTRYKYPLAPIILGLTLGSIIEESLLQTLMMSRNGLWIFLTRPASLIFVVLSLLFLLTTFIKPQHIVTRLFRK